MCLYYFCDTGNLTLTQDFVHDYNCSTTKLHLQTRGPQIFEARGSLVFGGFLPHRLCCCESKVLPVNVFVRDNLGIILKSELFLGSLFETSERWSSFGLVAGE